MNTAPVALPLQFHFVLGGAIGAIGKNIARGVSRVEEAFEFAAVVNRSGCHAVAPDDLVLSIGVDMILVAEVAFAMLLRRLFLPAFYRP